MKKKLFSITIIMFIVCLVSKMDAQVNLKTEYFGNSNYVDDDTEETLGKGSAILYQADVNIPLYSKLNEREQPSALGFYLGGAYADLTNKNFSEDLVLNEIMNLYLGLSYTRPIGKKWSMMVSLGAGLYSPTTKFSAITSKNLLGNGAILFVCDINKNLKLGGGVAVNNSFGFPMAFPAIYFNWSTDGRFVANVSLMDGLESSFGYSFSDYYTLSAIMDLNGQMAMIRKDDKDQIFSHQYLVTGLRNELTLSDKVSIPITVGINMLRMTAYSNRNIKSMFSNSGRSGYFDVSLYVSAGISVNF